ncbi:MAG: L-2-hydroxyglutarate oxidase, partial [Saccharomonospora viridis]
MSARIIGIVGGGIVGLAVGRELTRRYPGTNVVVFEKEDRLGAHQTSHNSGVVHAGVYYRPGSLKAELCTRGRSMLREYCRERGLPYDECGKLVVAVEESELGRLDALEAKARRNGVPGLRRVAGSGITEVEPHAAGLVALHSPATAITDYAAVAGAYGEDIEKAGGEVLLSTAVVGVRRRAGRITVATTRGGYTVDRLVVCAGLQADRVSRLADGVDGPRIVPFRGEYLSVVETKRDLVRGMIYPVPDPRYPFLGVHFTRSVSGELEIGPNAVLAFRREGYRLRDVTPADLWGLVTWPGFWRMGLRHWRTGLSELWGSLSVRAYMRSASRYVPDIGVADVRRAGAGVRAQAVDRDGSLV